MAHKLLKRLNSGVQEAGERFDKSKAGKLNLRALRFAGRALKGGLGEAMGDDYKEKMDRRKK